MGSQQTKVASITVEAYGAVSVQRQEQFNKALVEKVKLIQQDRNAYGISPWHLSTDIFTNNIDVYLTIREKPMIDLISAALDVPHVVVGSIVYFVRQPS